MEFLKTLKENFKVNTPIFRKEIFSLFPNYSSIYIYQLIKKACMDGDLVHYSMGIYFLPKETEIGTSTIVARDVMVKRFIEDNGNHYGVYSGETLKNLFNCSMQVPMTLEIVSNNESTRCREIALCNRNFIVHKSRVEITNENYKAYTLLQLFTDTYGDNIGERGLEEVDRYIKDNEITKDDILSLARYFPAKTMKNMLLQGVI